MTNSDVKTESWAPFPDAKHYEADALSGRIRSLDRTKKGRFHKGIVLKLHHDPDGYLRFNYTDDNDVRHHNVSVARMVLMAHDPDGYFPGAVACHQPGMRRDDCRLVALRWDTEEANRVEALGVRLENSPPKPKPPKVCPRCQKEHEGKGRNCHECVVQIGVQAADYLAEGSPLDKVAEALDYPPAGVFNLAKRYGGLRCIIGLRQRSPIEVVPLEPLTTDLYHGHAPSPWARLRSVLFRREASRQNSDGA